MAYQELRARALNLNQQEAGKHPCSKGNGACCEPDIFLTNNDARHIRQEISQGRIPLKIVRDAKKRLTVKNRERCAFLGDDNQCTIYEARPLICILTGAGSGDGSVGLVVKFPDTIRAVAKYKATGEDTAISCRRTSDPSCQDCIKVMKQTDFKYKASSIAAYEEILQGDIAAGKEIITMNKFIKGLH